MWTSQKIHYASFPAQILKEKAQNGSDSYTFLERLLDVSNENPNFTHDDVIAETATILTGVIINFSLHPILTCTYFFSYWMSHK